MLVGSTKEHFPLLPFDHAITYLTPYLIKPERVKILDLSLSSESSEPEIENTNSNDIETEFTHSKMNIEYNNFNMIPDMNKKFQKKKSPVKMTEKAENFRYSFYRMFTTRKKFPKKYVVEIHNEICQELNLRRIQRDECRSIHLYFNNFADKSEEILKYLQQNKDNLIQRISGLKDIHRQICL